MGDRPAGGPPYVLHCGDVLDAYAGWPAPHHRQRRRLRGARFLRRHQRAGRPGGLVPAARGALAAGGPAATTLWFWNTELGWATVHPLLVAQGWDYVQAVTWDKGVAHIAGNATGRRSAGSRWSARCARSTSASWSYRPRRPAAAPAVAPAGVAAVRAAAVPGQRRLRGEERRDQEIPDA